MRNYVICIVISWFCMFMTAASFPSLKLQRFLTKDVPPAVEMTEDQMTKTTRLRRTITHRNREDGSFSKTARPFAISHGATTASSSSSSSTDTVAESTRHNAVSVLTTIPRTTSTWNYPGNQKSATTTIGSTKTTTAKDLNSTNYPNTGYTTSITTTTTGAMSSKRQKKIMVLSLMTLTGVLEAICFRRFGCFPNMMTGNTVRCMAALADWKPSKIVFHASLIVGYLLGGFVFRSLDLWNEERRQQQQQQLQQQQKLKQRQSKHTSFNLKWLHPKQWLESTSVMQQIVVLELFCFIGYDFITMLWSNALIGLPFMSVGYGMINAMTIIHLLLEY